MRIRVEYEKGADIKFLAHLDMVRAWDRLLRRSQLAVTLSQGFNPHARFSLGTVLPVGLWGRREYMDFDLEETIPASGIESRLKESAPPGVGIRKVRSVPGGTPSLMAAVNAAVYGLEVTGEEPLQNKVRSFLEQDRLLVYSERKKGQIDVRPGIYWMRSESDGGKSVIYVCVASAGDEAVRFRDLLTALADNGFNPDNITDNWREGNYIRRSGAFFSPLDLNRGKL